jgi:hypothetical protein
MHKAALCKRLNGESTDRTVAINGYFPYHNYSKLSRQHLRSLRGSLQQLSRGVRHDPSTRVGAGMAREDGGEGQIAQRQRG